MIEAVIFDYGGVISTPLQPHLERFEAAQGYTRGALFELLFGEGGLDNGHGDGPPDPHDWHRLERGELDVAAFISGVEERAPEVIGERFDVDAFATFMAGVPMAVHWPVVHRVRELKGQGLGVAILTNNVKEFASAWKATFPVGELFEVVVDSSEVGLRKPDPRIYELTCERLDVAPTGSVFLDDLAANVAAARALGMETVHVDSDITTALTDLDAIIGRRGIRRAGPR